MRKGEAVRKTRHAAGGMAVAAMAAALTASAVTRNINVWYPGETAEMVVCATNLAAGAQYEVKVTDWLGNVVLRRDYDRAGGGRLAFAEADTGRRFGAFGVEVVEKGTTNAPVARTAFARLTSKTVKPSPWIGTGGHPLHPEYGKPYRDGKYLDMLSAAGIGVFRQDFIWCDIERKKGEYQMPESHERFFTELERRGIVWMLLMQWINQNYENVVDPDAFAAFCGWTARHWKGRAKHYEIFNEPHHTPFVDLYTKDGRNANSNLQWIVKFTEFSRKAAEAIHAADPQATVAVTGEDWQPFIEEMLSLGIAQRDDIVSMHPYCHWQPRPEREFWFRDDGAHLRGLAAAHGGAKGFCITEAGWTTFVGDVEYLKIVGCYPRSGLEHQARYLMRMYLLAHLTGVEYACQYNWMNEGKRPSYTEHNFGQLYYDATPKPAFAATAFLSRLLGQSKPCGERSPEREKYRLAEFEIAAGRRVIAGWCVEGECDAALPQGFSVDRAFDLMGNDLVNFAMQDGKVRLTENPIYLISGRSEK